MKKNRLFGICALGCFYAVMTLSTASAQNTYPTAPGSYSRCPILKYTSSASPRVRLLTSSASTGTATTSSAGQESVQSWVVRSTTETNTTYAVKLTTNSSGEMSMCAYTPNRVLATLMPGKNYSTFVQEMAAEGLKVVRELMRDRNGNPVYIIEAEDTETDLVDQMTMSIESTGSCSLIRPDHIYEANTMPNDTNYSSQWALEKIDAPKAWETRTDASSVPVAVLDTGVNYNHYDLNRNLWINNGEILGDGIDNDGNGIVDDIYGVSCIGGNVSGNPMDDNGHGSHCAGIIGAAGNNRQWIAGVAWRASIMALKFLNSEGKGSASDAITCLCYAESKNVKIVNCSFGVNQWDDYLYEQILKMSQKGVVFACAAGNAKNGEAPRDNDEYPFYPCNYPIETIVGVAASDTDDSLANFSYYGAQNVDIAAPGVNIYSTVLGTYGLDYKDGTSMATPHVVGALALLMAHYPNETSSDIINRLYAAAKPVDALKGKVRTGARLSMSGFFGISAPDEISVTQGTVADAVVIYWTAVNNGTHYRVWRASEEEGAKTLLCDWQQGLTFADETADPETTYWYYIQAASSADGASSSTYSMGVSGFRPKVDASRLTVSFNANGGQMEVASKVYHAGEKYAELPVPAYSGKVFLGWFTSAEGGTHLDAESYVRSGVTTLYAHWIDESSLRVENLFARQRYPWNGLVDITFNLFGVPSDETASVSLTAKEENSSDILDLKTFVGAAPANLVNGVQHVIWNATADTQAILYTNMILMATVKMDEKPLLPPENVVAECETSPDSVTVTWNAAVNATSYEIWRATVHDLTSASLLETASVTSFSDKSAVPGVTYYYWVRSLNAKKTSEYSASTEGMRKKVVSEAVISGPSSVMTGESASFTCTVTYNDGKSANVMPTWSVSGGSTFASIDSAGVLTANEVAAVQSVTVTASYTYNGITKTATKDVTVNTKSVTVSFDANGGSVSPATKSYTVYGTYGSLPTPTRSGYTFNGWYTAASGGTKITASSTVSTSITTLYAQWKISAYTVSFNANGGTGSMTAKSVTIGSSVTLPKCTFTKSGYVFAGWATSSNGFVAYGDCVSITPTANVVLYAQWISNAKYMVIDLSAGTSASQYPVSYLNDVPSGGWTETYKTTKLVMRRIESGTFMMGSPTSEQGRYSDEVQHQVTISKPFYIGVFEVTQRQYELVMGVRPSEYKNNNYYKPRPVEKVSRANVRGDDSVYNWPSSSSVGSTSFLGKLRSKTGILSFDLPTEAQWEYACRAGTTTSLNSGKNIASIDSYDANLMQVARCSWNSYNASAGGYGPSATSASGTAVVGSYLPNTWGLYDMHGNVEEMCLDWSGNYPDVSVVDPVGPSSGSDRASRGGNYLTANRSCRSASRGGSGVGGADYVGFRISCLK